jgi:hypothetical protein
VKDPKPPDRRKVIAKDKGVAERQGLKEIWSKALARRIGSASEANRLDEVARHTKVRTLYGKAGL